MKNINLDIQKLVNGGAKHYHWKCKKKGTGHVYESVPRNLGSAKAWAAWHNTKYHKGSEIAVHYSCVASCGSIRTNYPT